MPDLTPIYQISSDYVDKFAAVNPVAATSIGVAGHDDRLTDFSPEGQAAAEALRAETMAELMAAPVTSERDRVARDVMADVLRLQSDRYAAGEHLREMSIIGSASLAIRRSFDLMPKATTEDWATVNARLKAVPEAVASFERTLEEGVRRGMTAARRQVEANIEQAESWSGARQGSLSYFDAMVAASGQSGALQSELEAGAKVANEAYVGFSRFLREKYFDAAVEKDGVGRERYQLGSRVYNGTELDLDETYQWGWDELYRIEREMRETCQRILPQTKSIAETIAFLESDPNRAVDGVDAFRQWMQDLQDRTIAELDGVHFDVPGPIRKIEAMIAPPGGALAMYYTGPSEDFSRPGRTWYPTGGKTRFPLWGEVSIAYHEGVPGGITSRLRRPSTWPSSSRASSG